MIGCGQVTGANIGAVESAVQRHRVVAPQTFTGSGFSLGGRMCPPSTDLHNELPSCYRTLVDWLRCGLNVHSSVC